MAFVKVPSKIIYGSKSFTDFYYGDGYIFDIRDSNNQHVWIMTNSFLSYSLSGDMGTLDYAGEQYGGEPCFSGNGWKLYYCPSMSKWILTQNAPWWGYVPKTRIDAYYDTDLSSYEYDYEGDLWWESTSLNTTPFEGAEAGTFTFGVKWSDEWGLSNYTSVEYRLSGDVGIPYSKLSAGSGPCGVYENGKYVGYPQWHYTLDNLTRYVVKYGDDSWYGLEYINIRYIDDERLDTRWRGYLAVEYGFPNLDTNRGWYAILTEPVVGSDFTLVFFHWVWNNPDDHDEGGEIVQESSWEDAEGVTHSKPDITVSWDDVKTQNNVAVDKAKLLTKVDMFEAAIWR